MPITASILLSFLLAQAAPTKNAWTPLFPEDGVPKGWKVTEWSDVAKPAAPGVQWKVINGVLHGSEPRGTWLMSEQEYENFELEFEWKIGPRGNSGCGLRFPAAGDPAFDGLELQMCDPRYYGDEAYTIPSSELTGGLYRAIAPLATPFKNEDWNKYHVKLLGQKVEVTLNGQKIQDINLKDYNRVIKRHNGQDAVPMKDRPLRGHIGFQELSRGGGHVEIRNARIKILD